MKELLVVRHGHSDHMEYNLTGGATDSRLTALGIKQAELTGKRLKQMLADRSVCLYCSSQTRTEQTAQIIADSLQIQYVAADELRELDNGAAAGLTTLEANELLQPLTEPLVDWKPYPLAESWRQMSERVVDYLAKLDQEQDVTVLVLHTGCGNAAITWWLGIGIGEKNIIFQLEPCAINHFNINIWQERTVLLINDTSHLASLA